jgi:hypothetical protein
VCATPVDGYELCYQCSRQRDHGGMADAVAPLTYAVAGGQSGYVMRGYKANPAVEEHRAIVAILSVLGVSKHGACAGGLVGRAVTHWATVPSLPAKPGEHPLHRIIARCAQWPEVPLVAASEAANPRELNSSHFSAGVQLPGDAHVLLVDDTWTSGGHAQSATMALRRVGAARVSVLVIARWVRGDYGDNAKFLRDLSGRDYDPDICPWTGDRCP